MNPRMIATMSAASLTLGLLLAAAPVAAHCEIPCGIYGDRMRIDLLQEHFETVRTSMQAIKKLEAAEEPNANQLVRWVVNKDAHANKIQEIVYQYFMNQRITPVDKSDKKAFKPYARQIVRLHRMLVQAMKCKQSTDESHVDALQSLLKAFEKDYFKTAEHDHE